MLIRPAQPEDSLAVARVHVRSWQTAYRGLLPDEYLDQLQPKDRACKYTFGATDLKLPATIVAEEQGEVCGFATMAPAHDSDAEGMGELCALHVDPDFWDRKIGAALIATARSRLTHQGFRSAVLWLLVGNKRAERFYRIDQWIPDGARRVTEVWGVAVDEIRYQRALP